jgi:transcription elongation factor/antiterminator RfaH
MQRDEASNPVPEAANWYAVRTKPKQEARAESSLRSWGLEVLAPRVREVRHTASNARTYVAVPLFPSYLFARFDAASLLVKVRLTRGVHSVVGFGEYATPIDEAIVELIRGRIGEDGFVRIEEPNAGDSVKVVEGPLRALTGIFQCRRSQDRAMILLTLFGAHVQVQVPMAAVRKARLAVA